jgi:hypothetical protein
MYKHLITTKNPIKIGGWNHHTEDKRKVKKRLKDAQPTRTKEGRELVPLVIGSYFTHNPSNVANKQIMKFNSNKRSKTSISHQCNLPSL